MTQKIESPQAQPERPNPPVQVFQEMDRRDENQILAEMRGELLEEFVYSIRIEGRDVTNLSYAGIKEAIRRHGQIEILEVRKEEDEKEYRVLVRVRDHVHNIDVLGAATAEKNKPFAWVLAHNKAERNAFAKLLPAKLYATLIQEWLTQFKPGGPKQVGGTTVSSQVPAGSKPSPRSEPAWLVPITPNQVSPDLIKAGVRQHPLLKGLKSFGMVNQLGEEFSIVPERPVPVNTALVDGFLMRKIVEPLAAKHSLAYTLKRTSSGLLEAVLIRGKLEDPQIRELVGGTRWAFERALEEHKK
jgi:hypothetical protein